jgi:hypothetical protein
MDYKVVVTTDAEADLERRISYLLYVKKNEQALFIGINAIARHTIKQMLFQMEIVK